MSKRDENYLKWRKEAFCIHARFVAHKWPINGSEDRRFLSLAICGETGELANMVKKIWRGDQIPLMEIHKELADIRIYLELLAVAFDCDLDAMCLFKLAEVEKRLDGEQS